MDKLTKLALIRTATEYSEALFPENQMNWRSMRATFVKNFVDDFEDNYYKFQSEETKKLLEKAA